MSKLTWPASALAIALLAACAGSNDDDVTTSAATAPAPAASASAAPAPAAQPSAAPTPAPATPAPTSFTDAQLRSFAAAAVEINPIAAQLQTATPEQRTALVTQIRAALERNNIDEATYNAVASQAQADPTLATRIRTLHEQATAPNG